MFVMLVLFSSKVNQSIDNQIPTICQRVSKTASCPEGAYIQNISGPTAHFIDKNTEAPRIFVLSMVK